MFPRGLSPRKHVRYQLRRTRLALQLIEGALPRRLVRPPAQELGSMTKAVAADVIVAHFRHELGRQRLPFARALRAPARRPSRGFAAEAGRLAQFRQLLRQLLPVDIGEAGGEADMI